MVVLLVCDRQSWTRPALTRHGEGRRVPARAFPPITRARPPIREAILMRPSGLTERRNRARR